MNLYTMENKDNRTYVELLYTSPGDHGWVAGEKGRVEAYISDDNNGPGAVIELDRNHHLIVAHVIGLKVIKPSDDVAF